MQSSVTSFWEARDVDPAATEIEIEFSGAWKNLRKVVFSRTLESVGPNARLVSSEVAGPGLAANLARLGLLDEYRLYLMPVVLGAGKPFFEVGSPSRLQLRATESLPERVVLLTYGPQVGAKTP
jgi:dihydrofolate reductase